MGYSPKYRVGMNCFGLSCEDAQDKDDWSLRIKRQLANPGLPGKFPLKRCVYPCYYMVMLCFLFTETTHCPVVHCPVVFLPLQGRFPFSAYSSVVILSCTYPKSCCLCSASHNLLYILSCVTNFSRCSFWFFCSCHLE